MPAEQPKEALTQIEASTTAEQALKVRKLRGKDVLFKVWSPENQAVSYIVDQNAKTCTCPDFTNRGEKCKHIEVVGNIDEIRRQKDRERMREYHKKHYREDREKRIEYFREYWQKRYHSDLEFKRRQLEAGRKLRLKYREAYKRFKIEFGGKCSVCGENDLDLIDPHHPNGKEERGVAFILTKEFRDWVRYGIKPKVVLLCVKCHRKRELMKTRRKLD